MFALWSLAVSVFPAQDPGLARATYWGMAAVGAVAFFGSILLHELVDGVAWQHRHTTYPVVGDGRALGLVPFRCLAAVPRREWDERTVRDCMLPRDQVPTLSAEEEAADALQRLAQSEIGRALVVNDGTLAGMLSLRDLTRPLESGRVSQPRSAARRPRSKPAVSVSPTIRPAIRWLRSRKRVVGSPFASSVAIVAPLASKMLG